MFYQLNRYLVTTEALRIVPTCRVELTRNGPMPYLAQQARSITIRDPVSAVPASGAGTHFL